MAVLTVQAAQTDVSVVLNTHHWCEENSSAHGCGTGLQGTCQS